MPLHHHFLLLGANSSLPGTTGEYLGSAGDRPSGRGGKITHDTKSPFTHIASASFFPLTDSVFHTVTSVVPFDLWVLKD